MNTMMIRLLSAISFAVITLVSADLSASDAKEQKEGAAHPTLEEKNIDAVKEAVARVDAAKNTPIIIDAREVKDGDEIIKGAIVIPASSHVKETLKHSHDEIIEKLKDKTGDIIVYCGSSSCPASSTLAYRLVELRDEKDPKDHTKPLFPELKFGSVTHYAGGFAEWKEKGKDDAAAYPVETYKAPAETKAVKPKRKSRAKKEKEAKHSHDGKAGEKHDEKAGEKHEEKAKEGAPEEHKAEVKTEAEAEEKKA